MSAQCPARLRLDFDSIGCTLDEGHEGAHRDHGEDGEFVWTTAEMHDAAMREMQCSGSASCASPAHFHGCFADLDGATCDEPDAHPESDVTQSPDA